MLFHLAIVPMLLVVTSVVSAQQPEAVEKPPVTVLTGCLVSSGADTAVAGPSGRLYTLEVMEAPAKPSGTSTGSTPPAASKTTYSLSAPESVGLAKHDGHQVQLTGRLQAPAATESTKDTPPKPGGAHNTFNVTALKMISPKCSS